jgi:hypothetical protein
LANTLNTEKRDLAKLVRGEARGQSSPYIGVAVGTAQVKKLVETTKCFGNVGLRDRFQSLMLYDVNQDTIDWVNERLSPGGAVNSKRVKVFTPTYIPGDAGFARDPWAYLDRKGGLVEDYESLIYQMKERSETIESQPQMIMMFMGFGSHSILGWDIHQKIRSAFPRTLVLVVITTPEDPLIRRQAASILSEYTAKIDETDDNTVFMLLDDFKTGGKANDRKFAVLLASIEQANATDSNGPGTIVDVVNGLTRYSGGRWLGINVSHPVPLPTRRRFSFIPPWFRYGVMNGKTKDLELLISSAAVDIGSQYWQLADHKAPKPDQLKNTFVTVPLERRQLNDLKGSVMRWVQEKLDHHERAQQTFAFAAGDFGTTSMEWGQSAITRANSPVWLKALRPLRWLVKGASRIVSTERPRFYCHVGQVYVIQEATTDFRMVPTLHSLADITTKKNHEVTGQPKIAGPFDWGKAATVSNETEEVYAVSHSLPNGLHVNGYDRS